MSALPALLVIVCLMSWPRLVAAVPPLGGAPDRNRGRDPARRQRMVLVGVLVAVGVAFTAYPPLARDHPVLWLWSMAGPFAEPMARDDFSWPLMITHGGLNLAVIALHPVRPNPVTALASALGVGWWFLIGMSFTYAGV